MVTSNMGSQHQINHIVTLALTRRAKVLQTKGVQIWAGCVGVNGGPGTTVKLYGKTARFHARYF